MHKALKAIGTSLLIALACLTAVVLLFTGGRPADADPNALQARALLPFLRDGQAFRLADAYPEAWETAQLVAADEQLDPWAWQVMRAYDASLLDMRRGTQLLVFWRAGEVARMVRFSQGAPGMPWFEAMAEEGAAAIWGRDDAVFTVTLQQVEGTPYYQCAPRALATAV